MIKATNYAEAQTILKRHKRTKNEEVVTWDAGDGWTAVSYYCSQRKRVISATISPEGAYIV